MNLHFKDIFRGKVVKRCLTLPAENSSPVANLPDYMRNRLEIRYVSDIQQVLAAALAQ